MRRVHALTMAAVGLGLVILFALFFQLREPRYQGRSLSGWLSLFNPKASMKQRMSLFSEFPVDHSPEFVQASEAIRHIGAKAVPYLLSRFAHEPQSSRLRDKIIFWLGDMPPRAIFIPLRDRLYDDQRVFHGEQALLGFAALGTNGVCAIPELARLAQSQAKDDVPVWATAALGHIGPKALPQLLLTVSNQQAIVRVHTLMALRGLGSNLVLALP